jgi:hypothetical protein
MCCAGSPASRPLLEHKGKAMSVLRGHLNRRDMKPNDTAIMAVAFLAVLEASPQSLPKSL